MHRSRRTRCGGFSDRCGRGYTWGYPPFLRRRWSFFLLRRQCSSRPCTRCPVAEDWLGVQASTKAAFYSADEELVPDAEEAQDHQAGAAQESTEEATPKKKPRVTTASLAEQLGAMSSLLPAISNRLGQLQQEQATIRNQLALQDTIVPPRRGQQPVSTSLTAFAKMMGSPPRVKGAAPLPPKETPVTPSLDLPMTLQEQAEEFPASGGSTLARAVLEQSRALTTLVAQLQSGGDPLLDSQQSSSGISLGSKGAAGREKLQAELSARSGAFFLAVSQNAWRRMKQLGYRPTCLL